MNEHRGSSMGRYWDSALSWDRKFTKRRQKAYLAEESNLTQDAKQSTLTSFLNEQASRLDPPDHNFIELRAFLERASDAELMGDPSLPRYNVPIALLDDRRDNTGWQDSRGEHYAARDWDGYASYPPQGESRFSRLFSAGDLYRRLQTSVRR
ncbi:MAG: hypothetical protein Q9187_005053 [Circinaria calcarea]